MNTMTMDTRPGSYPKVTETEFFFQPLVSSRSVQGQHKDLDLVAFRRLPNSGQII